MANTTMAYWSNKNRAKPLRNCLIEHVDERRVQGTRERGGRKSGRQLATSERTLPISRVHMFTVLLAFSIGLDFDESRFPEFTREFHDVVARTAGVVPRTHTVSIRVHVFSMGDGKATQWNGQYCFYDNELSRD